MKRLYIFLVIQFLAGCLITINARDTTTNTQKNNSITSQVKTTKNQINDIVNQYFSSGYQQKQQSSNSYKETIAQDNSEIDSLEKHLQSDIDDLTQQKPGTSNATNVSDLSPQEKAAQTQLYNDMNALRNAKIKAGRSVEVSESVLNLGPVYIIKSAMWNDLMSTYEQLTKDINDLQKQVSAYEDLFN